MKFLVEGLPAFWECQPIQISEALLTYAAMQEGSDNKTRALLSLDFVNPGFSVGGRRKLVKEA